MSEFRFKLSRSAVEKLRHFGAHSNSEILLEALDFLSWAVSELKNGRIILSATPEGEDFQIIKLPCIQRIRSCPKLVE